MLRVDFAKEFPSAEISRFFTNSLDNGLTKAQIMQMYSSIYRVVRSAHYEKCFVTTMELFQKFVRSEVTILNAMPNGKKFLVAYFLRFHRLTTYTLNALKTIFAYLERAWIDTRHAKLVEGIVVQKILPACLGIWYKDVVVHFHDRLLTSLLEGINSERKEELVLAEAGTLDRTPLVFKADDPMDEKKPFRAFIVEFISMYAYLDKNLQLEGQANRGANYFTTEFEPKFIQNITSYYQGGEADMFIKKYGVSRYLILAPRRLADELMVIKSGFAGYAVVVEPKVAKLLDDVLIRNQFGALEAEFGPMLIENRTADLKAVIGFLSRLENGVSTCASFLQKFSAERLTSQIFVPFTTNNPGIRDSIANVAQFVADLSKFHKLCFVEWLDRCFANNKLFKDALDRAWRQVINEQSVGKISFPRLLNVFLDAKIKGNSSSDSGDDVKEESPSPKKETKKEKEEAGTKKAQQPQETEQQLEEVMASCASFVAYVRDKDEFFEYFRKSMSKRLLSKVKDYSEITEKILLSKLKERCGANFTKRLSDMYVEVQSETVTNMTNKFKTYLEKQKSAKLTDIDVEVQVLNAGVWPIPQSHMFPVNLPPEMVACQKEFTGFYEKSEAKRRLLWLMVEGTVTMEVSFTNAKKPITLLMTPLQTSIVLLFNEKSKWSFSEILHKLFPQVISDNHIAHTKATYQEVLRQSLVPLMFHKYSILEPHAPSSIPAFAHSTPGTLKPGANPLGVSLGGSTEAIQEEMTVYTLRETIPNVKKVPRKISFPALATGNVKAIVKQNPETLQQSQFLIPKENNLDVKEREILQREREFAIDASIVQIMKHSKTLDWNQLQVKVVEKLQERFLPEARMIKKRIESLIQRQFLSRDEQNIKNLNYIA